MTVFSELLSGLSVAEIPETHGLVPRGRQQVVVVVGKGKITDEVRVASEGLDGDSEVGDNLGLVVEFPDEDGFVAGGGDENLSVFVLLLGVSSFDGGDPIGVTLKVSDFGGPDDAFLSHHNHNQLINIKKIK